MHNGSRTRAQHLLLGVPLGALVVLGGCEDAALRRPTAAGTLRIYLARHGETDWNAQRRLQGGTDVPLNAKGRVQAAALATRLDGVALDAIYSSTLARSRETAQALDGWAPIEALPGLAEQSLGKFEGAYLDGRDPQIGAEYRERAADPDDVLDGGESTRAHLARVRGAIEEIRRQHPAGTVLIVGHGGTNQLVLAVLLDLELAEVDRVRQANDEVYAIDLVPSHPPTLWKLVPPEKLEEL
jgi:2,3-bisphosphoglycerate-dependent phosphoglycerate mutase